MEDSRNWAKDKSLFARHSGGAGPERIPGEIRFLVLVLSGSVMCLKAVCGLMLEAGSQGSTT